MGEKSFKNKLGGQAYAFVRVHACEAAIAQSIQELSNIQCGRSGFDSPDQSFDPPLAAYPVGKSGKAVGS